ncbi:MAG TPA: HupE/UreJ family protein, partial [Polyangia bacterium]|nr:HupE/UreJ family protein [Polyangia bacterium]
GSIAFVDFTVDELRIEQDVPVEELERALGERLAEPHESAAEIVARHAVRLRAYAATHVEATTVDGGRPWGTEVVGNVGIVGRDAADGPRAVFALALRPPHGDDARSVRLRDELVAREIVSHHTAIFLRSDWAGGVGAEGAPRLLGTVRAWNHDVVIRRDGSFWRGLGGAVALGADHIATGTDHLMFLLALMLAAPLVAARGRWVGARASRDTLGALARVVSAFTLGHSATLALGALGWVRGPAALVEPAIALSILVTALHAVRPIFPRRETWLAAAFGLIHGLAFARTLGGHDLGRAQIVWTLLGFNTGIELAQVVLLLLVVPWVLLLARTRTYAPVRCAAALAAATAATGWLLERTTSLPNPTARPIAWLEAHPLPVLAAFAATAIVARAAESWRARQERTRSIVAHSSAMRARSIA